MRRFQGGATWLSKQEIAQAYLAKHRHNMDKLHELGELMILDVGRAMDPEDVPNSFEEWGKHEAIRNRGMYAPGLL